MRKRWRYVGVYGDELMLCAARAPDRAVHAELLGGLGPRERRAPRPHPAAPGRRRGRAGRRRGPDPRRRRARRAELGEGEAIEAICPSGSAAAPGPEKRAGVPVRGTVEAGGAQLAGRRRWASTTTRPATTSATPPGTGRRRRRGRRRPAGRLEPGQRASTTRRATASGRSGSTASPASPSRSSSRGSDASPSPTAPGSTLHVRDRARPQTRTSSLLPLATTSAVRPFAGSLDGIELASGLGVMESTRRSGEFAACPMIGPAMPAAASGQLQRLLRCRRRRSSSNLADDRPGRARLALCFYLAGICSPAPAPGRTCSRPPIRRRSPSRGSPPPTWRRRAQQLHPGARRRRGQDLPRQAVDPGLLLSGDHLVVLRPVGLRHDRRDPGLRLRAHPGAAAASRPSCRTCPRSRSRSGPRTRSC